jgi:hypothetical protein
MRMWPQPSSCHGCWDLHVHFLVRALYYWNHIMVSSPKYGNVRHVSNTLIKSLMLLIITAQTCHDISKNLLLEPLIIACLSSVIRLRRDKLQRALLKLEQAWQHTCQHFFLHMGNYWLKYLKPTSWSWALLEMPPGCSYSRIFQQFMEPEGSLPCSQEPSTGPYPEPDQSSPYHHILSTIHFNTIHPCLGLPSSLSFWLSHQYPICIPLHPQSCYMHCPSHPL